MQARIYAFGEATSTYGQVASPKKEPVLKGGILEDTIVEDTILKPRPSWRTAHGAVNGVVDNYYK